MDDVETVVLYVCRVRLVIAVTKGNTQGSVPFRTSTWEEWLESERLDDCVNLVSSVLRTST